MSKLRCMGLSAWLLLSAGQVAAEDIDLFASGLASGAAADSLPNIIFVLDNTSNWSRQSQKWPDATQGQSEVRAIDAALKTIGPAEQRRQHRVDRIHNGWHCESGWRLYQV